MSCSAKDFPVISYAFGRTLFPCQVNGKLNTLEFLEACKGVVNLVGKLGSAFSPLHNDISCNISKIKTCFDQNPKKYYYIEDLILCEKSINRDEALDALLWLRRALHFTLVFFQNIINDSKKSEDLQEHMTSAYIQTLQPYHNWITRNLFKFFKNLMPKRSVLLSKMSECNGEEKQENLIKSLQVYFESLSDNITHINSFYKKHNLEPNSKT
ncbi:glycolipid transfer protein, putative [Pediculus humanus corporis]|uniref:Glycolipid transfer protein, putative n=1 Tax=Pediculus humanus subsp. corporis TaxID=121224 RepID=E0W0I1_PEDHC|nr:glycolipid transfer protein, putative [Pediculus humanus corporis]EEB19137.1 glycolipid transfer protein, putative [Pediculus humanus corporis]